MGDLKGNTTFERGRCSRTLLEWNTCLKWEQQQFFMSDNHMDFDSQCLRLKCSCLFMMAQWSCWPGFLFPKYHYRGRITTSAQTMLQPLLVLSKRCQETQELFCTEVWCTGSALQRSSTPCTAPAPRAQQKCLGFVTEMSQNISKKVTLTSWGDFRHRTNGPFPA